MKRGFAFKSIIVDKYANDGTFQSGHDYSSWEFNEWRTDDTPPRLCRSGFHCFRTDGINWIDWGNTLVIVQTGGLKDSNPREDSGWRKYSYQKMRIVKVLNITGKFVDRIAKTYGYAEEPNYYSYDPLPRLNWMVSDMIDLGMGNKGPAILRSILKEYAPEYL